MKRILAIFLTTCIVLISLTIPALSETWTCYNCGKVNSHNFCPVCGTEKPWLWICEKCQKVNDLLYCETCGSIRNEKGKTNVYVMDGQSMADTILEKDVLLFQDYGSDKIKRFDICTCFFPGREGTVFIKRIVGLPGERIKIEDGYLFVDGEKYEEDYINNKYRTNGGSSGANFDEVYIPKKGDVLSIEYTDSDKNRAGLYINGEIWSWRGINSEAISGDSVCLKYNRDGTLLLDGEDISNDIEKIIALIGKKFLLEEDLFFVMGDHRNSSNDSRSVGPLSGKMINGFMISHWRYNSSSKEYVVIDD